MPVEIKLILVQFLDLYKLESKLTILPNQEDFNMVLELVRNKYGDQIQYYTDYFDDEINKYISEINDAE